MEQRAPGHTVLDDKIYCEGDARFQTATSSRRRQALDFLQDPLAYDKREALEVLRHCVRCRHRLRRSATPRWRANWLPQEARPERRASWRESRTCVPAFRPTRRAISTKRCSTIGSATSAVITELNGWDSFNPGHLDQHLLPFYERGLADGTLTRESARELLECFFIKFNNHPAPPKVGVTAAESGTYTDFANINIGGLLPRRLRRRERAFASPAGYRR